MKKLFLALSVVLFLVAVVPVHVSACPKGEGKSSCDIGKKSKKCKIGMLKKKAKFLISKADVLGLSNDQITEIKSIKLSAMKDLIKKKADVEVLKIDMKAAMHQPKIDVKAVNKIIDQKLEAKGVFVKTFVKAIADLKNILTAEQSQTLMKVMKKGGSCPLLDDCSECAKTKKGSCPLSGKSKAQKKGSGY